MKTSHFKWLAAMLALIVLVPNCKKDNGNEQFRIYRELCYKQRDSS